MAPISAGSVNTIRKQGDLQQLGVALLHPGKRLLPWHFGQFSISWVRHAPIVTLS